MITPRAYLAALLATFVAVYGLGWLGLVIPA